MNAITPPKLIPPCHSAAAIGTLPMEHTKLTMAMNGPTMTFCSVVQKPWPVKNTSFHTSVGDHDGEEAGDDVADEELAPQHRGVAHRVAGGVGPGATRAELDRPTGALELSLAFVAHADHGVVIVAADGARLEVASRPLRRPPA